jgi:hypothetical protein
MAFDDREWPTYGTWVCDRDSGHRELLYGEWRPEVVKPCTFPGCKGVMTLNDLHGPFILKWHCEVTLDHLEIELNGKFYRASSEEDRLRFRADVSRRATD